MAVPGTGTRRGVMDPTFEDGEVIQGNAAPSGSPRRRGPKTEAHGIGGTR